MSILICQLASDKIFCCSTGETIMNNVEHGFYRLLEFFPNWKNEDLGSCLTSAD